MDGESNRVTLFSDGLLRIFCSAFLTLFSTNGLPSCIPKPVRTETRSTTNVLILHMDVD